MHNLEGKVRSFLLLQPRNGDYDAVLAFFRAQDMFGKAIQFAGAHAAEFHVPLSGSGPIVVTALWDSAEAYSVWRSHPIRDEMAPDMARLLESATEANTIPSGLYQIRLSATA